MNKRNSITYVTKQLQIKANKPKNKQLTNRPGNVFSEIKTVFFAIFLRQGNVKRKTVHHLVISGIHQTRKKKISILPEFIELLQFFTVTVFFRSGIN